MPANLPPQYYEVERRLRTATEPEEKIEILEEMLAIMPKHKGTDHLKADLRRKIAKLAESVDKTLTTHRKRVVIAKEGAAQAVIIGLPNSGKSQLVAAITNAVTAVADYPFTTQQAIPGMMEHQGIKIQLIDTVPITEQSIEWWLPNMLRRADAAIVVVDLADAPLEQMEIVVKQLRQKKVGLGTVKVEDPENTVFYQKALLVGNKVDMPGARSNYDVLAELYKDKLPVLAISAGMGIGLEELKTKLVEILDLIRVYTKVPGQKADIRDPIVLVRGSTLEDAARELHKDFLARLKYARLWGSGKHNGLRVSREHVLEDGDIIELHV
jgi:small GTP-binding protein